MAGLLGIGKSGLEAAQIQLQVTGNNIANVNTPGYVRREAVLADRPGQYLVSAQGSIGGGVDVVAITRRYDRFLAKEVTAGTAAAGGDAARADALEGLDSLLADTEIGIGAAIDDLRGAVADLANQPADPSAREVVLRRADTLADRFRSTAAALSTMASDTDSRIADAVGVVNGKLASIARINHEIASGGGPSGPSADLADQRDQLIDEVAGTLKVSAVEQADGSVSLFAVGGQTLVLGAHASTLVTQVDPADASRLQVAVRQGASAIALERDALGSGALAGLVRFRDDDLVATRAALDRLAVGVADAYNARQAAGLDATGAAGAALFDATGAADFRRVLADGAGLASAAPDAFEPASDNRNALEMVKLGDAKLVDGMTFTDAFAAILGDVGARTANAQTASATSARLLADAKAAFTASAGVNLDEEAARLLQYQQAYQANAKVIATAQTLFDSLLAAVGR
ncbi:MAG: flagellar hook-associated protein FlgK [Lautropia sp.]